MVEIRTINSDDYPAWDQYVLSKQTGGGYLSSAWKDAVEKGYGLKTFYLAAFQQKDLCGVLPLVFVKTPWAQRQLVSLPYCDYGGLFADDADVSDMLLEQAFLLASELRGGLEIRCPTTCHILQQHQGFLQVTDKCRMVLELPGNAVSLWQGFKSKLRSQVNRARKSGLVGIIGHVELLFDFYRVFSRNMRDLGSPVHSKKLLVEVIEAYGEMARVGVVYKGDLPVAAGIILLHGNEVAIPWASSLGEYNRFSPNMLLYWTLLEYAADHGFAFFDFGRSTPGEGTYKFKRQWGAGPEALCWYRLGGSASQKHGSGNDGLLRNVMEKAWQQLPLTVANSIGPKLRRYIDR